MKLLLNQWKTAMRKKRGRQYMGYMAPKEDIVMFQVFCETQGELLGNSLAVDMVYRFSICPF